MISKRKLPELRRYLQAEESLPITSKSGLATLVVPEGNDARPGYRWFKYKEAFSSRLLGQFLGRVSSPSPIQLLDPYCGVGTGLLSAQLAHRAVTATGIECNPFSAFVARTKLGWHQIDVSKFRALASSLANVRAETPMPLPALSSITTGRCITRHMAGQVVATRNAIQEIATGAERDALLLGLASSIEPISRIRRDGRALRIVDKSRTTFKEVVTARWHQIAADVESLSKRRKSPNSASVLEGDGRRPASAGIESESIDLIVTSPPYPNNIDYNEIYKLELWLLGFVKNEDEFLSLRKATFRSHPSCSAIAEGDDEAFAKLQGLITEGPIADLMGMVFRRVEKIEKEQPRQRTKVLTGYIYDTWLALEAHFSCLRRSGLAAYVVGNSLHGGTDHPYLVPTDLILAELARMVGFDVEEIAVARGLPRRLSGNHFLRDSVVVLRKP